VASLVLTSDNVQVWNSDFNFAGTNDLDLGIGAVSLGSTAGARTVTVDTGTLTVGGIISNGTATALTKAGAGALVLGGANLNSGGTTVNVGTVTVSDGAALGAGPLAVNNPSTGSGTAVVLNLNGSVATGSLSGAIAVPGTNTATINIASAKTLTVNQAVDGIYAGVIAGSGALAKSSAAKLTLTGLNSYSGGTMLSQGVLSINSFSDTVPSALGVGPNGITFNGGTLQYTGHAAVTSTRFTLAGGNQAFDITQSDANFTVAASYSASTITKLGAGTLTFGGAVGWDHENYGNGAIAVDNGTVVLDANVYTTGGNNPLFHAAFATVNDVQSPATLKLGTTYNNIKLNFANTFHMSGGTYDINGMTNNGCAQIDGSGTITNNGAADATVNVFANLTNAFSGNIVDGTPHKTGLLLGNVGGFGGSGAAVWTLSGANTYSGPTTAGVGTLKAGSATAFSPNSAFTVGATLDLAGFNNQIAGLTGAGTVKSSAGTAILTVNNDVATSNADFIFGGVLRDGTVPEGSGVLGLTKTGSKILTLSGANAYTGNTTISNGTLALTGSGSIANSPTIDVALGSFFDVSGVGGGYTLGASQTLKGNGTVIGPMTAAGTVAPGYSTGVLTVTGDATLNGTFSVDVETDGDSDRLDVTGNLALGPASVLSIVDIDQLLYGLPYTIATYGGTQSGTFAGGTNLPVGWSVEYGPQSSSGAITLTPEPATMALLGLGGLGLILSRKRK
jgi:autotransporter-associated beta strand protein